MNESLPSESTWFALVDTEENSDVALEIETALAHDDLRSGQLGTHIYRNFAEAHQAEPRDLVTAAQLKNVYYFHARYHYARYGTYTGQPACLVILDLSFQQYSNFRFKSAEIEMEFEDADNVGLNPHEVDIDTTFQPRVLAFEPQDFSGPVTSVEGNNTVKLDVPIQVPGGFVGITPGVSRSKDFVRDGWFKIHGVVKEDPPSMIHWTIREDKIRKNGIRSEVSVATIVSYFPGHRFAARVRVAADVFFPFLRPMCGKKDDPIYFDPARMRDKPSLRVKGVEDSSLVPGLNLGVLDHLPLKKFTRIDASGGSFLT